MTDAQAGLLVVAPLIAGFAFGLYRVGVLQRYSTAIAVTASCVIAAFLYIQQ